MDFLYRGKKYTIKVRHDVIMAAGPIETPKLLMLSGIGNPDHLAALNVSYNSKKGKIHSNLGLLEQF